MRKYNISACIVIQDLAQIKYLYKDEWESLIANCDGILFLGTSAQETLKYVSEQLGYKTIREKSTGRSFGPRGNSSGNWKSSKREVMTQEEVGRLPNDEVIVFTRGERPIRCKKYKGTMHPLWKYTEGEENIFQFNTMDVYDNQKISAASTGSLLKAREEAARFKSQFIVRKVETIEELGDRDMNELLDAAVFPQDEEEKLFSILLMECIQSVAAMPDKDINLVRVNTIKDVAPKKLAELVKQVIFSLGIDNLILFADNHCKEMCGVAMSASDSDFGEKIKNKYIKSYKEGYDYTEIKVLSDNYEMFESEINGYNE